MGTEDQQIQGEASKLAYDHERLTTPYGFHTTANEVIAGIDLAGKRVVVTGGGSGIGAETAEVLAGAGAEVTLAVRDVEAGQRVADDIADAIAWSLSRPEHVNVDLLVVRPRAQANNTTTARTGV